MLPILTFDAHRLTRSSDTRRTLDEFERVRTIPQGPTPLRLSRAAVRGVSDAMRTEPLLLKASLPYEETASVATEWAAHVESSLSKFQTNGNGMQSLRRIWSSNMRLETQLRDDDVSNPVLEWLATAPPSSVASRFYQLHLQLVDLVRRDHEVLKTPSFVNGLTSSGGGVTHFDDYTNLATVLAGSKTFFVAPPVSFNDAEPMGQANERLGIDPLDRGSPNPWRVAVLEPGDLLVLPEGWWHFVQSAPRSVMGNIWY